MLLQYGTYDCLHFLVSDECRGLTKASSPLVRGTRRPKMFRSRRLAKGIISVTTAERMIDTDSRGFPGRLMFKKWLLYGSVSLD